MVKEKRQMVVGNDNMLYSIVIVLTPTREATVRVTMGDQAHAAFLRTVQEADSALAKVLHLPHMPSRPFTVSPLLGVGRARDRHPCSILPTTDDETAAPTPQRLGWSALAMLWRWR
jgi:hypothetical protein